MRLSPTDTPTRLRSRFRALVGAVAGALLAASVVGMGPTPPAGAATEIPVLTSSHGEFQPARGEGLLGWEQNSRRRPNEFDVMVRRDGSSPVRVNPGRSRAAMGDFAGGRLVYQQYRNRRSDLRFYDLDTGARSKVAGVNTRHWEYWPSMSGEWLLYGRWNRSGGARRLLLHNLATGERRVLDRTKSGRAFIGPGQVAGNYAVWSTCDLRCQVFRYDILTATAEMIPNPGAYQRAPSVSSAGTVYFSRGGKGCGASVALVRAPVGGPQEVLVQLQNVLDIRDTYAYTKANGSVEVYYERNGCGKPAAADVYMVEDPALVGLTVELAGTGSGMVTSSPQGITCGDDCSEGYERETEVTLTAGAAPGSVFVGWTGACTGSDSCEVTMDSPQTVIATFLTLATITIVLDSVPDDPQDFGFDTDLSLPFTLDDDGSPPNSRVFTLVVPGTYEALQLDEPGPWRLTGIECLDPEGGSSGNVGSRRAMIDLDPGEAVQCTFTNTKGG
jgi:Divergent InlB B-repeat domain